MLNLFHIIFYQPIFNLLVWLYNVIPGHDIGIAIIILTIVLKFLLFPLTLKSMKSQKALQDIQPKINELKEKYKNSKEELAKATMELYRKDKVSPFSSCLPILIQLPFLIALYQVLAAGLKSSGFDTLYPFVANPGHIDTIFLGFIDLAASKNVILCLLAGVTQFFQGKMMSTASPARAASKDAGSKDEAMLGSMNKQMMYMMPVLTIFIGYSLPGGLVLYWLIMNALTIVQQWVFLRPKKIQT